MNYRVGICDADTDYAEELMKYINARSEIPITLYAFSGEDYIQNGIEQNRLCLLLAGETVVLPALDVPQMVIRETGRPGAEETAFYKYQSAEVIAQQMIRYLKTVTEAACDKSCLAIACISPYGRSGKTRLAQGICRAFQRSLYVNMESFQQPEYLSQERKNLCEKALYFLVSGNDEVLRMKTETAEFDRLLDGTGFTELRQLTAQHVRFLCGCAREENAYRRLVFDLDPGALSSWSVLREFDRIYVTMPAEGAVAKKDTFFAYVRASEEGLIKKLRLITVPDCDWDSEEMLEWIEDGGL